MSQYNNNTVTEASKALAVLNRHLEERNCKHTLHEIVADILSLESESVGFTGRNKVLGPTAPEPEPETIIQVTTLNDSENTINS